MKRVGDAERLRRHVRKRGVTNHPQHAAVDAPALVGGTVQVGPGEGLIQPCLRRRRAPFHHRQQASTNWAGQPIALECGGGGEVGPELSLQGAQT